MFLSLSPYSLLDSDIKDNLRTKYIYMLPAHMFFMSFVKVTTFSPHGGSRVSLTCCQCILGLRPLRNSRASVQWALLQFSSVAQLCPTVCDPMNRSTPGLPVHHQLLELTSVTSSARAWWTIAHQAPLRTKELRLLNCGVEDS